jgi:hypothetical protein
VAHPNPFLKLVRAIRLKLEANCTYYTTAFTYTTQVGVEVVAVVLIVAVIVLAIVEVAVVVQVVVTVILVTTAPASHFPCSLIELLPSMSHLPP